MHMNKICMCSIYHRFVQVLKLKFSTTGIQLPPNHILFSGKGKWYHGPVDVCTLEEYALSLGQLQATVVQEDEWGTSVNAAAVSTVTDICSGGGRLLYVSDFCPYRQISRTTWTKCRCWYDHHGKSTVCPLTSSYIEPPHHVKAACTDSELWGSRQAIKVISILF